MKWKDFLELHKNLTQDEEIACILWTRRDVYERAAEEYLYVMITNEIVDEVLSNMDRSSDCENGMTWDSLEYHLEEVLREKELIS
jgi:hypothetical protein